jgi:hypothetical protein
LERDLSALTSVLCKIPINIKILVVTDVSNSSQLEGDFSALTSVLCKIPINLKILVVTDVRDSRQLEGDLSALTLVLCKIPINLKTFASVKRSYLHFVTLQYFTNLKGK